MPVAGSATGSASTPAAKASAKLSEADYTELVTAAHQQLHAPLILCWDNLNTHISGVMRAMLQAHQKWLTVVQMPAYAPDLNPVEGAWSNMKNGRVLAQNRIQPRTRTTAEPDALSPL